MAIAVQIMAQVSVPAPHQESSITTAPVREHICLFTHDLRRKQKRWKDGRLKYHTFNRRVMVYDDRGNFIGDTHWRQDYDLADGDEVELERGGIIVQVGECVGSRDQDLSELIDKRAEEKSQRQAAAAASAASRRPPPTPVGPLHAVRPQPLPPRHLHDVIGTPSAHHGRAVLPKESPYDERRRAQVTSQNEDTRPAKRQRHDRSPPRKSGYAQNLFGATLTLSGCSLSQAPACPPLTKSPHNRNNITSPPSSGQSSHDGCPSYAKQSTHKQVTPKVPPSYSKDTLAQAHPSQLPTKPAPQLHTVTRPGLRCPNSILGEAEKVETVQPQRSRLRTESNKENTSGTLVNRCPADQILPEPREAGVSAEEADAGERTPLASLDEGARRKTRNEIRTDRGGKQSLGSGPATSNLIDLTLDQTGGDHQQLVDREAKTELRIKPRKKRGLLMVSERDAIRDSSRRSGSVRARPGTETSSSPSSSPVLDSRRINDFRDKAIDRLESMDIEAELADSSRPIRKSKRIDKDAGNDNGDDDSRSLRPRGRSSDRDTIFSDDINEVHEMACIVGREMDSKLDDMPPPRLARLGRKSIRSKEVIGFIFDEELDEATSTKPATECQSDQATVKRPRETDVAADSCIVTPPAQPEAKSGRQNMDPEAGKESSTLHGQSAEPLQTLAETIMISKNMDISPNSTTTPAIGVAVLPITNPATRGRKAAKPTDAAGQMPICPLPKEVAGNLPMQRGPKKRNAGGNQERKNTDRLPGFSRANGGPWSREAHDLFDFKRPS